MAWETRRDRHGRACGRYYTRSRRENGRVVREYVGTSAGTSYAALLGLLGLAADAVDEMPLSRADDAAFMVESRAAERAVRARQRARMRQEGEEVRALGDAIEGLVAEALAAQGYHQHRGEWRRRRG